jgi:hypothetical protein
MSDLLERMGREYAAFLHSGWRYDWESMRCVKGWRSAVISPACIHARREGDDERFKQQRGTDTAEGLAREEQ